MADEKAVKRSKKKVKSTVPVGVVHIRATFNNTLISITDLHGNVLTSGSAGEKFKGSRKSTPFAAQTAAEKACLAARDYGLKQVEIEVCGPGPGGEAAAREIGRSFKVTSISNVTGIPHNGCQQQKERRV